MIILDKIYLNIWKAEAYLEPSRISSMKIFHENNWRFLAVIYFRKKASLKMFDLVRTGNKQMTSTNI